MGKGGRSACRGRFLECSNFSQGGEILLREEGAKGKGFMLRSLGAPIGWVCETLEGNKDREKGLI